MTSPGDDFTSRGDDPRRPGLSDQLGAEGRRMSDLLRGGRGYWRGGGNRTPGGCGSSVFSAVTILGVLISAFLYVT